MSRHQCLLLPTIIIINLDHTHMKLSPQHVKIDLIAIQFDQSNGDA